MPAADQLNAGEAAEVEAEAAPGLGASQTVHLSVAVAGFASMQVPHVH